MTIRKRKCLESVAHGSPNRVAMANPTVTSPFAPIGIDFMVKRQG